MNEILFCCFFLSSENCCLVHGGFSNWNDWFDCSVSCGGGVTHRTRSCDNPSPKYGGFDCIGTTLDEKICNVFKCPGIMNVRKIKSIQ